MNKVNLIFLSFLLAGSLYSQGYRWQAEVEDNITPGFFKVELSPEIVSQLNTNFSDIRITDDHKKETPYFIEKEPFSVTKRVFKEYDMVQKIRWRNGATVLVVENKDRDTINNIQLQIKNFDVRKRLELAGSDDYMNWYTIKENYLFNSANGEKTTSQMKSLNFNYTDYRYYRIVIYDCFSLPINVLKIGYYDTFQEEGKFNQLAQPVLTRKDSSNKKTYLKVNFASIPYWDKLVIKAEKPTYYYRNARICLRRQDKKGRVYYEVKENIVLNSNSDLTFYSADFPHKTFYVVIDNADNPELENIKIDAYQLKRYLVSHLEAGENYKLIFENKDIQLPPNYDIHHFKNKIRADVPILSTGDVTLISYQEEEKSTTSAFWMWGAIVGVALFLGYFSYKMIVDIENSKEHGKV
jgi:hypothetical protein